MYIYQRQLSGPRYRPREQPIILRPSQRYSYYPDRPHLSDPDDTAEQRKGTQVLYVRPTPPRPRKIGRVEYKWSFDTAEGRREYEAALDKHLKDKKVLSGDTAYEPLSSSGDIAKLASKKFANLVLIVHSAENAPAIGVDLGKPDWIKDHAFAKMIAPFGYTNITILGCDSVSNKFTPNLARILPKGSTVIGHKGGDFAITRHFEPRGRLQLTHVKSNLQLKAFKTEGKSP
jgi:hypothetical protein